MDIIQKYMTRNRCYSSPVPITVKKLVLHSLGVAQPDSDIIYNKMNTNSSKVSVHGFIEADRIIQTLPWNYKGWHVGSGKKGSYNNCAIGIELCEPKGHTYNSSTMVNYNVSSNKAYFTKVYNNAVQLFAMLSKELELDPLKDIVCHCEVYSLGYGSNHADVMHWFPRHKKTMDTFRADVRKEMKNTINTVVKKISASKETELIHNS